MLKEGDKHRWGGDGGGRRYGTPTRRRKCWVEGVGWVMGVRGTGFFSFFRCSNKENARRRPGPSAQDPRKKKTLRWVRWCRTMVQNHHRGGRDGWWVVLVDEAVWGWEKLKHVW